VHKKCYLTIAGLLLFCVVIILPPLIHGYIYPNIGDDVSAHLQVFDKIQQGNPDKEMILSYRVVGYPIVWLSNLTNIDLDVLYLWFNYIVLILIGLTIFFVFWRLISLKAGWLALLVTLFCSQSVFFQFYYGQLYNAINLALIFPLLMFFSVRYLTQGKTYQLILAFVFGAIFGAFHASGIYLPVIAGGSLFVYIIYQFIKKKTYNKRVIIFGGSMVILPVIAFLLSMTNTGDLFNSALHSVETAVRFPIIPYLWDIVSPTVLILVGFLLLFNSTVKDNINSQGKVLLIILLCAIGILAIVTFIPLSVDPFRQALDLSTLIALLVAILVSFVDFKKMGWLTIGIVSIVIAFGLFHNLPTWFSYNSAISNADKEAIEYMNTQDIKQYNCSPQVAYWIYSRFTDAEFGRYSTDFIVVRNIPMTPRSDPENYWHDGFGIEPDENYKLLKTFKDNRVTIDLYGKR